MKNKKVLIAVIVAAVVIIGVIIGALVMTPNQNKNSDGTTPIVPEENNNPEIYSRGLEFALNDDGKSYSVRGIGTCADKDIIIPSTYESLPVTKIYKYAFLDNKLITSIVIPNSIISVGEDAFDGCTSLKYNEYDNAYYLGNENSPYLALIKAKSKDIVSCDIHKNTKIIADKAFDKCKSLLNIDIPDSVRFIGEYAFQYCELLQSVSISNNVNAIGHYAFYYCTSLTSVNIPESIMDIGYGVFSACISLQSINIPSAMKNIPHTMFTSCGFESITIPGNITSIGPTAFLASRLREVIVANGLTEIDEYAFSECRFLSSITLPASLTTIGYAAFRGCSSLQTINFEGTVEQWNAIEKGEQWDRYTDRYTIYCIDGQISNYGDVTYK